MNRATMISSAEHTLAVARLGTEYDDAEYLEAIDTIRATGRAEEYANNVLGKETEPASDDGADILKAAEADLRARGIQPESATQAQMVDALTRVSP